MASNTNARARTSGATKATATKAKATKATKATATTAALAQPKTPEEMADIASAIVAAGSVVTPLLARFGLGMLANIVDRDGAIRRLVAAGKGQSTASQYASAAVAIGKAYAHADYRKAVGEGIGYDDAYQWARAIVAADKAGTKAPTRKQAADKAKADKAARAAKAQEDRAKADKAKAEPATVADVVALIGTLVDDAAKRSGDAVGFYENLTRWAASQYEARKAAADMARATTAK
jgi:hypothetical protein